MNDKLPTGAIDLNLAGDDHLRLALVRICDWKTMENIAVKMFDKRFYVPADANLTTDNRLKFITSIVRGCLFEYHTKDPLSWMMIAKSRLQPSVCCLFKVLLKTLIALKMEIFNTRMHLLYIIYKWTNGVC
jgi:hypothetical protein